MRADFETANARRQAALVRGALENEAALWRALEEADKCGVPQEFLEEPNQVAHDLSVARAEIQDKYLSLFDRKRSGRTPPPEMVARAVF